MIVAVILEAEMVCNVMDLEVDPSSMRHTRPLHSWQGESTSPVFAKRLMCESCNVLHEHKLWHYLKGFRWLAFNGGDTINHTQLPLLVT